MNITVKAKINSEVITPLQIGNITYTYPEPLTTTLITEIVVLEAPIQYPKFAATYGQEPNIAVSRNSSIYSGNAEVGSMNYSSALPLGSFESDPDEQVYGTDGLFNPEPFHIQDVKRWHSFTGIDTPRWSQRSSSAYYPQLDFFPRYNQWFASTVWSTPYDPTGLTLPANYPIMFVLVDRANKKVYYKEGLAQFAG